MHMSRYVSRSMTSELEIKEEINYIEVIPTWFGKTCLALKS